MPDADSVPETGINPDQIVRYKSTGDDHLHLHIFEPEDHPTDEKRPAIVFYFGGGWTTGSPNQFYPQASHLASRGMVAISAEYRVSSRNQTTPYESLLDAKSAMRWIKAHAEDLGIDSKRVIAAGGSAGGHLAAAIATTSGFHEDGEDESIDLSPAALVLFNPVYDNGPTGFGHEQVKDYWEAFSPMHNIDANIPPAIVMLGTEDHLVPVETANEFKRKMEALGVRSDLHLYEGQGHGFFNPQHEDNYAKTLKATDDFLVSLGFIKPLDH